MALYDRGLLPSLKDGDIQDSRCWPHHRGGHHIEIGRYRAELRPMYVAALNLNPSHVFAIAFGIKNGWACLFYAQ